MRTEIPELVHCLIEATCQGLIGWDWAWPETRSPWNKGVRTHINLRGGDMLRVLFDRSLPDDRQHILKVILLEATDGFPRQQLVHEEKDGDALKALWAAIPPEGHKVPIFFIDSSWRGIDEFGDDFRRTIMWTPIFDGGDFEW